MSGDVIQVLNDPQSTLVVEKLVHGTHLVLRRGLVLQRGLTRIKIMELEPSVSHDHLMCPSKPPKLSFLGHVDMDTEASNLTDLKHKIISLREECKQKQCQESHLRVRLLSKALTSRPGKILKESNLSLKAMEIGRSTPLVIQVLPKEECLR